ncbi:Outer membrane protein assembly factor BamE [Bordetella tumbae]
MSIIARIPTRFLKTALAATAIAAVVAGCSSDKWGFPYKAPVQQGNWITQEQVALLQPGMTREQVRFALGSPTLTSVLHADRWDYPYYFKPGYGDPQERKFTVWFDNDRLVRWEGDKQPELQPFQLNAEGKPQGKTDEQIDAETARQNAEGAIQSAVPADAAQLPALGTPPGGALPADGANGTAVPASGADTAVSQPDTAPQPASDSGSGIRAPSMSESDTLPPEDTSGNTARQRELRLNAPSTGSSNPATGGAEPLR